MQGGDEQGLSVEDVLEKAYERLLPSTAYLVSSTAGFAASVVVFATWLLRRMLRQRQKWRLDTVMEDDEKILIKLSEEIRELRGRLKRLEKLASSAADDWTQRRLERAAKTVKAEIEELTMVYELVELRMLALEKLKRLGDERLLRAVYEATRRAEEGKLEEIQYRTLAELERRWRERVITLETLQRIVES